MALGRAQKPLIFAGGGVIGAEASGELRALAELLQAPVIASSTARGAISDRSPLSLPMLAAPLLIEDADVILVVGSRFAGPGTAPWGPKPGQTVIQLDIDPEEIGRNRPADIAILGDAKLGLAALVERTQRHNRARDDRSEELGALQRRAFALLNDVHPQADYALAIRAELPDDGIVVGEMTQVAY